jgi:Mn-dependent DtxR family transcriptional regulator
VHDALIASLAAYGPTRREALALRLRVREGRLRRQLDALWRDDLVSVDGMLYRLTPRGQARASVLRERERRFEGLIRTRLEA